MFECLVPHAIGSGPELLPDSGQTGVKVVDESRLDRGVVHLQDPRHGARVFLQEENAELARHVSWEATACRLTVENPGRETVWP